MDNIAFNCPSHPGLNRLRSIINGVALKCTVPPCALAAIAMRESGGRNILQEGMPAGDGCGVGLCQITAGVNWRDLAKPMYQAYNLLDPQANLEVAARFFLAPAIAECLALRKQYAAMNAMPILFYAFASYNAGFGAVQQAVMRNQSIDAITTDNYGSGTLAVYQSFVAESHAQQ